MIYTRGTENKSNATEASGKTSGSTKTAGVNSNSESVADARRKTRSAGNCSQT